jgi:hypothetical protein
MFRLSYSPFHSFSTSLLHLPSSRLRLTFKITQPLANIGPLGGSNNYLWFVAQVETTTVNGPVITNGIVHVDLTDSGIPTCVHDPTDRAASDFELFTPHGTYSFFGANKLLFFLRFKKRD